MRGVATTASAAGAAAPRRRGPLWLALPAAVLLGVACTASRPKIEAPTVTLDSVRILRIADASAALELSLGIANPNSFALPVDAVDFEVTLDGRPAASAHTLHMDPLPAGGEAKVELAGQVDVAAVATALMTIGSQVPIEYTVKGTATLHDGSSLTLSRKGDIPVARFQRLFGHP